MKQGESNIPTIPKFLSMNAAKKHTVTSTKFRVGLDPFVHSANFAKELTNAFLAEQPMDSNSMDDSSSAIGEIDTLDTEGNLIDAIWGTARPPLPQAPFRVHPLQYAGRSVTQKIQDIREEMEEYDDVVTLSVFSALDDIAYLFNMRATGDIDTCPVGIAYAMVEGGEDGDVVLFCEDGKVASEEVQAHLAEAGVVVRPYSDILTGIQAHLNDGGDGKKKKVWIDKSRANYAISRSIPPTNSSTPKMQSLP